MEVCGTHTMAIARFGLRKRFPKDLNLISGPGCPVCVTPCDMVDQAIAMANEPGVCLVTFGDMLRVPGSSSSLQAELEKGCDIRLVYSPFDALEMANQEPHKSFVFLGIGFETTSPLVAATVMKARETNLDNFFVLPAFKLIPPALHALASNAQTKLRGYMCPGHVSTIIGTKPYQNICDAHRIPCVVTGFEAKDILQGLCMLLAQTNEGEAKVENQYTRAVQPHGNKKAKALLNRVFSQEDTNWRGIGDIPGSGLSFNKDYSEFDARTKVLVRVETSHELPKGCACGEVLSGLIPPPECPLYARKCTPEHPIGPCMVSSEGACAAFYTFGE